MAYFPFYNSKISNHHYFLDFAYSNNSEPLSQLVGERIQAYPCSGEINYTVMDANAALQAVRDHYADSQALVDTTDGLSLEFADWRLNLRSSNTEPLLRLNIETRSDLEAVQKRLAEVESLILEYA